MEHYKAWYLPDGEQHYKRKLDRNGHYQRRECLHAMDFVKEKVVAYDVGANIGFWSKLLAEEFLVVCAFEPVSEFRECFKKNVSRVNVELFPFGFSDKAHTKRIQWDESASGGAKVSKTDLHLNPSYKNEVCEFFPLDYLEPERIDLLKLDCEGYEYFILKGGEESIKRLKPIINIEDKFDRYGLEKGASLRLLESWGAKLLGRCYDDCVYGWA